LFESIVVSDGTILVPSQEEGSLNIFLQVLDENLRSMCPLGLGLKASIETIDNRGDFKIYMQNYAYARGPVVHKGPRREGPLDEGFVS
jgi:hypothetical protein